MKAVRIQLFQSQANYRKEETLENKMTYPLPPMSTIIGAIHKACAYTEYHNMKVSIQGSFESMQKKPYTDYAFLNSTMNDRGILVKMKNPNLLSLAYDIVAKARSQGADFDKETKIDVINRGLLDEYKKLRLQKKELDSKKKEEYDPVIASYKNDKKACKDKQKLLVKKSPEYIEIQHEIENIDIEIEKISSKYQREKIEIDSEYSKYASLIKSLKYYEVLYQVHLIIHITADDHVMKDILEHVHDITSIGRSEDFVSIKSAELVDLFDDIDYEMNYCENKYAKYGNLCGYISDRASQDDGIDHKLKSIGVKANGTRYFMNKDYCIEKGKRVFNKKWVTYASRYLIDPESNMGEETGLYHDGEFIVSLI